MHVLGQRSLWSRIVMRPRGAPFSVIERKHFDFDMVEMRGNRCFASAVGFCCLLFSWRVEKVL